MSLTSYVNDPEFRSLYLHLRTNKASVDAVEVTSGIARERADRSRLNRLVDDLNPTLGFSQGEAMYEAIATHFPPHDADADRVAAAISDYLPELLPIAIRNDVPVHTAFSILTAFMGAEPTAEDAD